MSARRTTNPSAPRKFLGTPVQTGGLNIPDHNRLKYLKGNLVFAMIVFVPTEQVDTGWGKENLRRIVDF
ncbi:hypothetical protein [Lunatimonas lonarensis]|uniref:hypothetical protein n=1 Tax=Lunatimonas lonarensis TaxID=1232681 RepID=UPI0005673ACD|nr:hypothetical protein [Lunatimonas lonarensis]